MDFQLVEEGDNLFCECREDGKLVDRCLIADTSKKALLKRKNILKKTRALDDNDMESIIVLIPSNCSECVLKRPKVCVYAKIRKKIGLRPCPLIKKK